MKKTLLTTCLTFFIATACALPVGNPADPIIHCQGIEWNFFDYLNPFECVSLRLGFYGDYVWNRHLEIDNGPKDGRDVEHFEIYTNAAYFALNFWDRFDLFATLGATNFFVEANEILFELGAEENRERYFIHTDTDLSWSIGLRGALWQCGCLTLGGEVQYFTTKPRIRCVYEKGGDQVAYPDDQKVDLKQKEWQFGLAAAYHFGYLIPYIGVKCGHIKVDFDNAIPNPEDTNNILFDMKQQKEWGYAIGVTLPVCNLASVTVEGRFADEKALYVNSQIRF